MAYNAGATRGLGLIDEVPHVRLPPFTDAGRQPQSLLVGTDFPSPEATCKLAASRAAKTLKATAQHRKRLLIVTNSVAIGGMERHVELLIRHLDRTKYEIYTMCPDWYATTAFDARLQRISDHHVLGTPDGRCGIRLQIREIWTLWRRLRRWRVDVLHMHLTTFRGGFWVLLAARAAGVPMIICTEHLAPEGMLRLHRRLIRNAFVRLLDRLVCVSEKNREARARYLSTPPTRTSVVVNGVDTADFEPISPVTQQLLRDELGIPQRAPVIGSAVRLEPEKGISYLLDAMPAVLRCRPDAYLLLVGDGTLRAQLEAQARELGIGERVVFAGFQPDPRPFIALMDVFVLPVPVGSMSIGLLEAMAMRRAVVITFGDPGEAVIHEESGLWARPRDPAALAQAITRLLADPALAQSFGEAARQRVEEHFSAASVARQLSALYQDPSSCSTV